MVKIFLLVSSMLAGFDADSIPDNSVTKDGVSLRVLADCISQVESNNSPKAVGDNGKAIGAYQLHSIFVKDCNRIVGYEKFKLEDRWDVNKSREMFYVYSKHYAKGVNKVSAERIARCFNGGPTGHQKGATLEYWNRVKRELEIRK